MNKIKVGDTVVVMVGKDKFTKGKKGELTKTTGKVLKINHKDQTVIVEGVNKVKKHSKPQGNEKGGIFEKEAPIHISNVMVYDPKLKVPTRVGIKEENGKKVRYAKKSGVVLE